MPVAVTVPLRNVSASEDESVTLSCKLSKPDKPVKWYKDGKILKDGVDCKIHSDRCEYILKLPKAKTCDTGTYTMKGDKIETSAKVTIKGKDLLMKRGLLWPPFSIVNRLFSICEYQKIRFFSSIFLKIALNFFV